MQIGNNVAAPVVFFFFGVRAFGVAWGNIYTCITSCSYPLKCVAFLVYIFVYNHPRIILILKLCETTNRVNNGVTELG